jgi:hypothetical protein
MWHDLGFHAMTVKDIRICADIYIKTGRRGKAIMDNYFMWFPAASTRASET